MVQGLGSKVQDLISAEGSCFVHDVVSSVQTVWLWGIYPQHKTHRRVL